MGRTDKDKKKQNDSDDDGKEDGTHTILLHVQHAFYSERRFTFSFMNSVANKQEHEG